MYLAVTRLWGDADTYLEMVDGAFDELKRSNYTVTYGNMWMLDKCDDYGMLLAILELCPDAARAGGGYEKLLRELAAL